MHISEHQRQRIGRLAEVCTLVAGGQAVLALWSWGAGVGDMFTIGAQRITSPSTALVLALASLAVFLLGRWPERPGCVWMGWGAASVAAVVAVLALGIAWGNWNLPLERWLAQSAGQFGTVAPHFTCPWSGTLLLPLAVALLCRLPPLRSYPTARSIEAGLATAIVVAGAGLALGHATSGLWAEAGRVLPVRLWTAITITFIGLALCGQAMLGGTPVPNESTARNGRRQAAALAVFNLLALAIGLVGALYLRHEQSQRRTEIRELLQAIGDLKAGQISNWRQERLGDAQFFAQAPFLAQDVEAFLNNPAAEATRTNLLRWLTLLKGGESYAQVALFDTNGSPRLSVPAPVKASWSGHRDLVEAAVRTRGVVVSDLHREAGSDELHIGIMFAVFAPGTGRPLGAVLLHLDPRHFLFPLLRSWPTPSQSAETLLIRREGNEVVFLNELPRRTNSVLARALIEPDARLVCARAALGQTGEVAGVDYAGTPVVAAIRAVPDSPWFMVAKVDQREIYAPLHQLAWLTLALTVALAGTAGLVVRQFWTRREIAFARQELAAEGQRRELAERVNHLMKGANDIILLADDEWRIVEANDRAVESYGYSQSEFRGMLLPGLRAGQTKGGFSRHDDTLKRQGQAVFETVHRRKDGSSFPVEVSSRLVEIGGVRYNLGLLRDITSRKRAEQALRQSEERWRALMDHTPVPVQGYQADGTVIYWNRASERLYGYTSEEALGRNLGDLIIPPEIKPHFQKALEEAAKLTISGEFMPAGEVTLLRKDGSQVVVHSTHTAVCIPNCPPILFCQDIDLTERERAEQVLRESQADLKHAEAVALIGNWRSDWVHNEIRWSEGTYRIFGVAPGTRMSHARFLALVHPDDRTLVDQAWQAALGGAPYDVEHRIVASDGVKWVRETGQMEFDAHGTVLGAFGTVQDITARKLLEEQFLQAQKMEAVGQLAGGVAHDFNNILAAAMLQVDLMLDNPDLTPETREDLQELAAQNRRAANLTRQLLLFGRRSVMQKRILDVNEVTSNLLKMLGRLVGETIDLQFQDTLPLPPVDADAGMLEQVLVNLVVNARDAMPRGGKITLATALVDFDAAAVANRPERRLGRFVALSVTDTGSGIPDAIRSRLFEPFFTTKAPGWGTGLGLATVYGIAKQHLGWVELDSVLGQGTTFRLFLPALEGAVPVKLVPSPEPSDAGGHETILLVEDNPDVRRTVSAFLTHKGYRVVEAENGPAALALWTQHDGEFDLIFADMVMPEGMTGLELIQQLRQSRPSLKAIISSGYSDELVRQGAARDETITYLPKPCPPPALITAIRECLEGPSPDSPSA